MPDSPSGHGPAEPGRNPQYVGPEFDQRKERPSDRLVFLHSPFLAADHAGHSALSTGARPRMRKSKRLRAEVASGVLKAPYCRC